MRYLIDTNVFNEIGKSKPHQNVDAWLDRTDDSDLAVSVITIREINKGIAKKRLTDPKIADAIADRVKEAVESLGENLLPVDRRVAELWGELLGASDKHVDDTGLAATARVHGLILVTRNLRDFAGRGVDLLDPFKDPPQVVGA